jgi:hypothetical protein
MDDNADAAALADVFTAPDIQLIDGVPVVSFAAVVARLSAAYPSVTTTRIESILLREWDAFTAGRPLVVPAAVESGVREILEQR